MFPQIGDPMVSNTIRIQQWRDFRSANGLGQAQPQAPQRILLPDLGDVANNRASPVNLAVIPLASSIQPT